MKRLALQNKQVEALRMALRARKVFGTFEKRAPGLQNVYFRLPSVAQKRCMLKLPNIIFITIYFIYNYFATMKRQLPNNLMIMCVWIPYISLYYIMDGSQLWMNKD